MTQTTAEQIITKLKLEKHIEGGYFREIYRSSARAADGRHAAATSIYYLLPGSARSAWHRVACDELWAWHAGTTPLRQFLIFPEGSCGERTIGPDSPQSVIPAGTWQTTLTESRSPDDWALIGAFCAPGFEYADYTPGDPAALGKMFPAAMEKFSKSGFSLF